MKESHHFRKPFTRQKFDGSNVLSPEDCLNIGNTIGDIANGAIIVTETIERSISNIINERLRMFTDSHNYWNDFINQVEYPCPVRVQSNHFQQKKVKCGKKLYLNPSQAHYINEENVRNIINPFANFFTQIQDLLEIARDASTIMQDWAETMQDQVENVFNCEYSVLLGFDIGIHLPQPIGSAELGR